MENQTTIFDMVFRYIQNDPDLWNRWNKALTYRERAVLMVEVAYMLGKEGK